MSGNLNNINTMKFTRGISNKSCTTVESMFFCQHIFFVFIPCDIWYLLCDSSRTGEMNLNNLELSRCWGAWCVRDVANILFTKDIQQWQKVSSICQYWYWKLYWIVKNQEYQFRMLIKHFWWLNDVCNLINKYVNACLKVSV